MDYNTQRPKLVLPEYGRHIQKLVEYVKTIPDRDERNRVAQSIIAVMGNLNPHLRDITDFKHKLWDHLALMADFDIDVDSPYPIPTRENITEKPKMLEYNKDEIRYKHYGRFTTSFVKKAATIEDPEERKAFIEVMANHMKKSYLAWNREAVNDEIIFQELEILSGHTVKALPDIKLTDTRDILSRNRKVKFQKKPPIPQG